MLHIFLINKKKQVKEEPDVRIQGSTAASASTAASNNSTAENSIKIPKLGQKIIPLEDWFSLILLPFLRRWEYGRE